jgi:uncharacterized membrane protein
MLSTVRVRVKQIFQWRGIQRRPYECVLWMSILLYGLTFSYFTAQKHYAFSSYAWDLGTFDQALYTTVFHGRFFYSTPEQLFNLSGSYFAVHFSPILFVVLPFYAVLPSPTTLLVMKSFLLALGAFPLYLLAKESLKREKPAFVIAIAYLLYPGLQAANWFDFQPQVFLPLLLFSAGYFLLRKRWPLYVASAILTLMVEEHVAFIVLLVAVYYAFTGPERPSLPSLKPFRMTKSLALLLVMGISALWFLLAKHMIDLFPIASEFVEAYKAVQNWEVLGLTGDPLTLPLHVMLHPLSALQGLLYDYPLKLLYVTLLFGPLLFLPLRSKLSLVILVLIAPFLISNFNGYYTLGCHYTLYVLPLVFLAALEGLSESRLFKDQPRCLYAMLATTLLIIVCVSPLSPVATTLLDDSLFWYPDIPPIDERIESQHAILRLIPSNASILTQNHLFPHVSTRLNAYVIPIARFSSPLSGSVLTYLRHLINESEYVLLDLTQSDPPVLFVFQEVTASRQYGAYAFAGGTVLFKKHFLDPPLFIPHGNYEVFLAARDLTIGFGQVTPDPSSLRDQVVLCPKDSRGGLVYGPYMYLPPGHFDVTFLLKTGEHDEGYLGALDVADDAGNTVLATRALDGSDLESHTWINLTLPISSIHDRAHVECRLFTTGAADIYLDRVIIQRSTSASD